MAEETRVSREELYEKVWTEPVRTVAKGFGVSDVALAKQCRRLKIPLPGRGYWSKKAAGKNVRHIPLPALPPNDAVTPRAKTFSPPAVIADPELPGPVADQIAFEADPANAIVVREDLRSPHPLVKATRDVLEGKGHAESWRIGRTPRLDIDVSNEQRRRALRIMDALVRAFEARGWKGPRALSSAVLGSPNEGCCFRFRRRQRRVLSARVRPFRIRLPPLLPPGAAMPLKPGRSAISNL